MKRRLTQIPRKIRAPLRQERSPVPLKHALWGLVSGTAGILAIFSVTRLVDQPLLIGSFGASAVLLFGATDSLLAQPRNLVGGHCVSAAVAVGVVSLFGSGHLAMALGVGLAILAMNLTHTTHPPGGATALIGVQGSAGPAFIVLPVLTGALILLTVALLANNLVHHRRYPRHWF